MYTGYTTEDGIQVPLLQSFLELASAPDSEIATLYEDSKVKVIPVMLSKDGMQLKPGLLYDSRQGKLICTTLDIDYNYVKNNSEPDRNMLKKTMVREAEVMCLTTADSKFALPVGVNHLTKGLTAADTFGMIKREIRQLNVCLHHLKYRLVDAKNVILKDAQKCCSNCSDCLESQNICQTCFGKRSQNNTAIIQTM